MALENANPSMQTYVANIEKTTGKNVDHWAAIVKKSKLTKHGELVMMLKKDHGITHGYANMIVHYAKGNFEASKDGDNILTVQYKGKENLKPWYDKITKEVAKFGKDVQFSPKKTYVSLVRKKQFALIQPSTKTRLDIGLNIKGVPPTGNVEEGKSWNQMCTHRIRVEDEKAINKDLIDWIKKAYEQAG